MEGIYFVDDMGPKYYTPMWGLWFTCWCVYKAGGDLTLLCWVWCILVLAPMSQSE